MIKSSIWLERQKILLTQLEDAYRNYHQVLNNSYKCGYRPMPGAIAPHDTEYSIVAHLSDCAEKEGFTVVVLQYSKIQLIDASLDPNSDTNQV